MVKDPRFSIQQKGEREGREGGGEGKGREGKERIASERVNSKYEFMALVIVAQETLFFKGQNW